MSTCIYALKLTNNKYYVGSTYNIYQTLKYVFSRKTTKDSWLQKHTPIYVHKIIHNCEPEEEHKYLLQYIKNYGVDNVRGPSFDAFVHEQESIREIKEMNI